MAEFEVFETTHLVVSHHRHPGRPWPVPLVQRLLQASPVHGQRWISLACNTRSNSSLRCRFSRNIPLASRCRWRSGQYPICLRIPNAMPGTDIACRLMFHGLQQQAQIGPCNVPSPYLWNRIEKYAPFHVSPPSSLSRCLVHFRFRSS